MSKTKILVTGGAGFLGCRLVAKLKEKGCGNITIPTSDEFDLREKENIIRLYERDCPDIVIHLAARVGGIGANMKFPGEFFYDNLIMGIQVMEYARQYDVKKFVAVGTACAYPKFTKVPFKEDDLWSGYPEETNAPYGLAKKMLLVQTEAYRKQYSFNAIYLLPANLYGPGDNFNPETSHVIPAIIKRFFETMEKGKGEIMLWGSGRPTREFLYVDDCAEAIILAAEQYNKPDPVNIGTGREIAIKDLADTIARLVGFRGQISWDTTKPDGQPRRCLDVSRAKREFGFRAKTDLEDGLKQTIEWYRANRSAIKLAN